MTQQPAKTFTGLARKRKTSRLVHYTDVIARTTITVGGLGTIIAILGVCVFLVWVAVPLLYPATIQNAVATPLTASSQAKQPIRIGVDEYGLIGWAFYADGTLDSYRVDTGSILDHKQLFSGPALTSSIFAAQYPEVAFGFADGRARLGKIGFEASFVDADKIPSNLRSIKAGEVAEFNGGMLQFTGAGQYRLEKIAVDIADPVDVAPGKPLIAVDYSKQSDGGTLAALTADGQLKLEHVTAKENIVTGKITYDTDESIIPFDMGKFGKPMKVLLGGQGDAVFLAWADGRLQRYNSNGSPRLVEELNVLASSAPGNHVTAVDFINGRATLVVGDSAGHIQAWFVTKPEGAKTSDGGVMAMAHDLAGNGTAVTTFASSALSRMLAIGFNDGNIRLYQVTSEKLLADVRVQDNTAVKSLIINPRDDGMVAISSGFRSQWAMNVGHAETSFNSLFGKVWYEGYESPQYVWQSSSGTDESEPKFGLMPLIFGTLKATVFSLSFGVPIAILAAIYTSEFLHPRVKGRIKPVVEAMASLPSVVLGFLAATIFAPVIEDFIPAVISSIITVPAMFLIGAYLWQLIPHRTALRLAPYRFACTILMLPIGIMAAAGCNWVPLVNHVPVIGQFQGIGPLVEHFLFAGDIRLWLAWNPHSDDPHAEVSPFKSPVGGWIIFLIPICAVFVGFFMSRVVNLWLRSYSGQWERSTAAIMDIVKFLFAVVLTLGMAVAIAYGLTRLGLDPRGSIVDTYVQRNSLIVGVVMGFAIIPIIYTISEDALSSVPDHLRSASLGAGATPWQTTIRIIVPTAMSGLFSAVMIGVGRAVGETMIVLMAAGNTPIMEWNIFNGFRTLSANIATELPEAVKNSTHYRVLFLTALVLFVITFVLNTIAEIVRIRFRKRSVSL